MSRQLGNTTTLKWWWQVNTMHNGARGTRGVTFRASIVILAAHEADPSHAAMHALLSIARAICVNTQTPSARLNFTHNVSL